jgi:hypothetical protein
MRRTKEIPVHHTLPLGPVTTFIDRSYAVNFGICQLPAADASSDKGKLLQLVRSSTGTEVCHCEARWKVSHLQCRRC